MWHWRMEHSNQYTLDLPSNQRIYCDHDDDVFYLFLEKETLAQRYIPIGSSLKEQEKNILLVPSPSLSPLKNNFWTPPATFATT
jgi:hypothetical protein